MKKKMALLELIGLLFSRGPTFWDLKNLARFGQAIIKRVLKNFKEL